MIAIIKNSIKALGIGFLLILSGLASLSSASAADKLKIGFVYVGPIGDHGWSYQHDVARLAVEKAFGDRVETTYVENVPEGADAERVITQLVNNGHNMVFTTSFGFMNPTIRVAKRFPDVIFEQGTGYKRADNVSTYQIRYYEGRYVSGVIAGLMSKTGKAGYIGSFPIPEVVRGINAFTLGARSVNPNFETNVVWVSSWFDPAKEGAAASALIDQGADFIMQHTDSPAPLNTAQSRGVIGVGQASDMYNFAPKAQVTAAVNNWADYYVERVQAALDDNWKSIDTWEGFASDRLQMAKYTNMPAEVQAKAEAVVQAIKSGKLHPFAGPIISRDGVEEVPAGQTISDADMQGVDYFVQGVVGNLDK